MADGRDERASSSTLGWALAVLTVVGLAMAATKYLDAGAVLQAWRRFSWGVVGWLVLLPALYLAFKSIRFAHLIKPVSDVHSGKVAYGYAASQAASLLPGGVAMRAAMMHRLGIPVERASGPVLANSASDQLLLLCAGLVLCYYYEELRFSALGLTAVLAFLAACLYFDRSRERLKGGLKWLAGKFGQKERMEGFFLHTRTLADPSLFALVMFWTLLANAISLVVLCLVVGALGYPVEPWPLAAAFVVPNLLGRLSPFPAGAGVVEAGMVGFLAAQTGITLEGAAVATVAFRVVDVVLPALYGAILHLLFFRLERRAA